jgi:hypothetical protein
LRRADQGKIGRRVFLVHTLRPTSALGLREAHHFLQGLARAGLAQQLKAFVQALDLRFGLPEMLLEQPAN